MKIISIIACPWMLILVIGCSKENATDPTDSTPPGRYSFAAAFDRSRGKLVMFGGFRNSYLNDTWEWDGVRWEKKSQDGPSPRNGAVMVYDNKRNVVILFGGDTGSNNAFADTWEWNGSAWRQLSADGPSARSLHSMAYDSKRDRIVLFGGIKAEKTLADLWEWDGQKWSEAVVTGPDARFLHASTYDENNGKVLIFGGNALLASTPATFRGDLWAWDGDHWEQYKNNGPSARDHTDMVYDQLKKKTIVHGGGIANGASANDTWEWDGQNWSVTATNAPAPAEGYKLWYDTQSQTVMLFGGFVGGAPSTAVWKLANNEWSQVP